MRQAAALALFFAAYLAVIHYPNAFGGIIRFSILLSTRPRPGIADIAASYVYVCLPCLILILALYTRRKSTRMSLALAAKILTGVAFPTALLDLLVAPFLAGPGGNVVFLIAVSVLSWHLLVFGWATQVRSAGGLRLTPIILLFATPIAALMAWSLFAAVSVATEVHRIAGDRPYCLARTEDGFFGPGSFGYGPIRTLEGLRGTRLFTTFTGYKDTSRWYFHAVLIVDGEKGREYWNWSIRRVRFEPFHHPERFVERPTYVCQPARSFLSKTPLL